MFATVDSRSCRITAYILRLLQTAQQSHLLHFVNCRNISSETVLSRYCCITAYVSRLLQTALLCDSQCVQSRRFIILRIALTMPKAEFGAAHSAKTAGTFYPCLPFIVSIVYPVKPHCKAKQSLYTETRFTRFSVLLCI